MKNSSIAHGKKGDFKIPSQLKAIGFNIGIHEKKVKKNSDCIKTLGEHSVLFE